MKHWSFIKIIAACLVVFLVYNIAIWELYTKKLLTTYVGDLSRMGYLAGPAREKESTIDLPAEHVESGDYKGGRVDVITMGDSFSNHGVRGHNPYYQDYIATRNNFIVMNIRNWKRRSSITSIAALANSGYFDEVRPKYVIIESVARLCVRRFGNDIDFDARYPLEDIREHLAQNHGVTPLMPQAYFINTGNLKFALWNLLYLFSDNAFFSEAYAARLDRPLFSGGKGDELLFYYEDLDNVGDFSEESVSKVNDNLNTLAKILKEKGITLMFMPVVEKLDLYGPYIKGNKYPRSMFFEYLRNLKKDYVLIDTKEILSSELGKGEKDLFYADDTHWSWKASEKIFGDRSIASYLERASVSH